MFCYGVWKYLYLVTLLQDAIFQRTHLTTHLISEYTFTQTAGSSSSSAASDNNVCTDTVRDEIANDNQDDSATVHTNDPSIQADSPAKSASQGADNVRERAAHGSTDVV